MYNRLVAYIWHFLTKEKQNTKSVMDMLLELQKSDKGDEPGPISYLFDKLEVIDSSHFSLRGSVANFVFAIEPSRSHFFTDSIHSRKTLFYNKIM